MRALRRCAAPGPARWATPSSSRAPSSPMPSTSPATGGATSGAAIRPTRSPPPRTTCAPIGWQRGRPWGIEVRLPDGFNFAEADQGNRQPVGHWRARGVTTIGGQPLPDHGEAAIIAPAGARGPDLRGLREFLRHPPLQQRDVLCDRVGHLADRIAGRGAFAAAWPRNERALSRSEAIELQERLTARGFDTGREATASSGRTPSRRSAPSRRRRHGAGRLRHGLLLQRLR
jgi:membrane-bound lytic murein transglycosylase B